MLVPCQISYLKVAIEMASLYPIIVINGDLNQGIQTEISWFSTTSLITRPYPWVQLAGTLIRAKYLYLLSIPSQPDFTKLSLIFSLLEQSLVEYKLTIKVLRWEAEHLKLYSPFQADNDSCVLFMWVF